MNWDVNHYRNLSGAWTPFDPFDPFQPLTAEQVERLRKELELYSHAPLIMPGTFQPRIYRIGPPPRYEPPLEDTP